MRRWNRWRWLIVWHCIRLLLVVAIKDFIQEKRVIYPVVRFSLIQQLSNWSCAKSCVRCVGTLDVNLSEESGPLCCHHPSQLHCQIYIALFWNSRNSNLRTRVPKQRHRLLNAIERRRSRARFSVSRIAQSRINPCLSSLTELVAIVVASSHISLSFVQNTSSRSNNYSSNAFPTFESPSVPCDRGVTSKR